MSARADTLAAPPIIDVSEVVEQQRLGGFIIRLVLVSWLVTFFDGFDLNVIAFAAPYLAPAFSLDKPMLANVFSSGIAGTLLGGLLFGFLGDRIGRRRAIIASTVTFGILMLLFALADSYRELLIIRFFSGVALGGALPLVWALSAEYAPARYRATIVTLITLGYGIGVSAAGPVSVALIPRFGWQSVFIFGGILSLLSAALLFGALPESLRFLATRQHRSAAMVRIVRRLAPHRTDVERARFILPGLVQTGQQSWSPAALFHGELRLITPLLWMGYAASSMTAFFFTTWGPLVFEALGFTRSTAAWVTSMNSLAGALGGLLLMRFTDRIGTISVGLMPAIAVPFLLIIGLAPIGHSAFIVMMGVLYIFLGGSHYGIISIAGTFYPTTHRALGTGWVAGIGKLGSIAGPWLGGWILASKLPVQNTFAVLAIGPGLFAACALTIGLLERRGRVHAAD